MPDSSVDAVLIRQDKIQGKEESQKSLWINKVFGPVLGGPRVHARSVVGGLYLLTIDPLAHLNFHTDHPRSGQSRYTWTEVGDGVSHGVLIPEEAESNA